MAVEIRTPVAEELHELVATDWAAFGNRPNDAQVEQARSFLELDRALVAVDRGQIVGTTAGLTMELTVPGPATVPTVGVTYVGVLPTHRRQGNLTALMARLHDDGHERGESFAALMASESTIYRRFGYGVAVMNVSVEIDTVHAALRRPVDVAGHVRLLDRSEMEKVLPDVFDRYRRQQPGEVSRSPGQWSGYLSDPEDRRGGAGPRVAVVWDDGDGSPSGYVTYRITQHWENGLPQGGLGIENLVALRPEVRTGLWQYCFSVDLVKTVKAWNVAPDEPLWWSLTDSRRLRTTCMKDFLWVRLLDVEAALSARTYASDAELVIEVVDGFAPLVGGRYLLTGGAPGSCRRTDRAPDLVIDVADLASTYLGVVRFTTLARAGLVTELAPGALARADALFAVVPGPTCSTGF